MKQLAVLLLWVAMCLGAPLDQCSTETCSCTRGVQGGFDLACPKDVPPVLIGTFDPGKYLQLQCNSLENWENLSLVSGLHLGRVDSISLRLCPLPGISFKELMATMGIPSTGWLQVQTHRNLSNTLTRRHLEGLNELSELHLSMNSLTELPEDLFQDLGNLTWLDLKNNNVNLPKGIFRYVPKLEVLELGGNNISYLEPGIFRNLTKLRLLNLWGNRLQNLTRATFSDVANLESLDLNSNGLVTLPPDVFADLIKLKKINLYANNFFSLPQSLFRSTSQLENIQIHSNRRALKTLPPAFFQNLKNLKELKLKGCNISYLPEDLLTGCTSLENLTLEKNLLTELPEGIFKDNKKLSQLNLSKNKLIRLPDAVFSPLYKLKILDMSYNELTNISQDLFSNLREIETLILKNNKITHIHSHAFEGVINLLTLDLSYNSLSNFNKNMDDSVLQSTVSLQYLYLSHNHLHSFYSDWRVSMTNLQVLDLSYNNYTNITMDELDFISNSLTIDLSHNNISVISLETAEKLAYGKYIAQKTAIPKNQSSKVILKHNPLACDCQAYRLVRYFRGEMEPEVHLIAQLEDANLVCATSPVKQLVGELVSSVDPRLLVCRVVEKECPINCTCYFRPRDEALLVDCAGRGLTHAPPDLPYTSETRKYTNHTELDLSENKLVNLPSPLGLGYSRVTHLNLANNNLTAINLTAFTNNLQVIELNNNNLTKLDSASIRMLAKSKSLEAIKLQNNPWSCDCPAKEFLNFLQTNFKKIPLINNVTCSNGVPFSKMVSTDLCPITGLIGLTSMAVAVLGIVIGGLIALYYRFQREIKIWLYSHRLCLWLVTEEELDKDKQYDAFVSYSSEDEDLITQHLQPILENGDPKYKLCLHYRDWVVGDYIPDQIVRSVEESRRTIVVLSPNFLKSIWAKMEFQTAHKQTLSERRAKVIIILYGDIGSTENLDPELKAYLSTNTYVKWGDPWFWEKLRYALPHPQKISKGLLSNGTDNSASTPPAESLIIEPLKTLSNSKPA